MLRLYDKVKLPVAMTIAGSDSGGGAGIEADLKTFAAYQVHGTVAITAITAQNTYSVTGVQDVDLDIIEAQIKAVADDIGIDAAKTGMLHKSEIIKRAAEVLSRYNFPLVVDPVMIAKSGAHLLRSDAVETLVNKLLPIATVVTPNRMEAEVLAGLEVHDVNSAKKVAKEISKLGPVAVIVKGGHIKGEKSIDILYYNKNYYIFESPRYDVITTHGTGCSFSAAITAGLANGHDLIESIKIAKVFISNAIKYGLKIGKGHGPVNPMAILYREASRYIILKELEGFLDKISQLKGIGTLIPEVGMNIAYASIYPMDKNDIAGIPGRIRKHPEGGIVFSSPEYGASDHLARYLLKIREYNNSIRVVMNIRYDENLINILRESGFSISYYDRSVEPLNIKSKEGSTAQWGVEQAVKRLGSVPQVIYHKGDVGKEPMIVLFTKNLEELLHYLNILLGGIR